MIPILIIFVSFLLLGSFYKTRSFLSVWGGLTFLTGLLVLGLRIKLLWLYPTRFFIRESFFISGIIVGVTTLLAVAIIIFWGKNNLPRLKSAYFWKLLAAYLPLGFLEQFFFQFVFLETVYFLTKGNAFLAVFFSAIFYSLFHLGQIIKKFYFLTLIMGIFCAGIYLLYGNLIWLALLHAILGTFLYVLFFEDNQLSRRLG
ncbi:MAG: CPBP family glutamic-type intramembrane protease [bacterium]|nr:CPBP family glutamic-type intramembrane protease [bacterium]